MRRWFFLAALLAMALPQAAQAADTMVFTSNRSGVIELYAAGPDGVTRLTFNDIQERQAVWSPDGSQIAFAGLSAGNWDIYTISSTGSDLQRLTDDVARDDRPKWTSDGRIVFQRGPLFCPPCEAWIMDADGSSESLIPLPGNVVMPEPSPRGQRLAYNSDVAGGGGALWVAHLNGKGAKRITDAPPVGIGDFTPRWSPSGNDLAFIRGDVFFSQNDLYVVHADGTDLRRLTETPGRTEAWPAWSSDGAEVIFTTPALPGPVPQRLRAVSLADGTERPVSTSPTAPLVETFDDGVLDSSLWHRISDPGGTIDEVDGRLVASISGSAVPGPPWNQVDQHWGSQCSLAGDFDYQVDWRLLTWPQHGGFFAQLAGFFGDASIARHSNPWDPPYDEQISAWRGSPFANAVINTTASEGSFRLVRVDGTIFAYERTTTPDWSLVFSAPGVTGSTVYGMGLWAPGWSFTHQDGSVAFDDFRLSSGELSCPSWWSDREADVR